LGGDSSKKGGREVKFGTEDADPGSFSGGQKKWEEKRSPTTFCTSYLRRQITERCYICRKKKTGTFAEQKINNRGKKKETSKAIKKRAAAVAKKRFDRPLKKEFRE